MFVFIITLLTFVDFPLTAPSQPTCGYESCNPVKEGVTNIHVISHSHKDVGWTQTVEEYYQGNNGETDGVKHILSSVVEELILNKDRRFIEVEIAYFWKWWLEQSNEVKDEVRHLVSSGRLEFVGGGWVMNDEATTYYQSIIDQFTWGFRKLEDMFGRCGRPRVGWQIDPFGHSRENAAIMAGLGFDGLFLGRIDVLDHRNRKNTKTMEMIWHTNPDAPGDEGKLFTGVLYDLYSDPRGFCFDVNCDTSELLTDDNKEIKDDDNKEIKDDDNKEIKDDDNKEIKVEKFMRQMLHYNSTYKSNHILVTMGGDFHYKQAERNYKNMDELIKLINELYGNKYHALYSTPSCYLKAVNEAKISFPAKSGDFFPYAMEENTYWSGYFTSRPTLKRFERIGNNYLQICKQLHVLSGLGEKYNENLDALREAMGVMQHHDAITGTEKEYVAHDYSKMLTSAIQQCDNLSNGAFQKLFGSSDLPQMASCLLLNISSCPQTETSDMFVLTLYNPLSRPVHHLVRVPISNIHSSYAVLDPAGKELIVQLVPIPDPVTRIPGWVSTAMAELVFLARDLPPLGFISYHVTRTWGFSKGPSKEIQLSGKPIVLEYDKKGVNLSDTGRLEGVRLGDDKYSLSQQFLYYTAGFSARSSGAYVFSPLGSPKVITSDEVTRRVYSGAVVTEIHESYNPWVSQVIRIVNDSSPLIELEWLVGPIPTEYLGIEVISQFICPNISSNGKFLTDSNGRSHLVRTRDHSLKGNISGNYYPVVTDITIEDENGEDKLSIITDRAQGGSSLQDGTIELMVHRRLTLDDNLGVDEVLNEEAYGVGLVARGKHWLSSSSPDQLRLQVQEKSTSAPWLYVSPTELTHSEWVSKYVTQYSGLVGGLPQEVHILTLEPWSEDNFLLRLENISNSSDVSVDIFNLFAGFSVENVKEMSLGGDVEKSTVTRMVWNEEETTKEEQTSHMPNSKEVDPKEISLSPYQIRTFLLKLVPKI